MKPVLMVALALLIIIAMFIVCAEAVAGTKVCDQKDPTKCAQSLLKNEAAPFSGQLLTPKMAIDQATKAHDCDLLIDLQVNKEKELTYKYVGMQKSLRAIDSRAWSEQNDLLQKRLQEAHTASERSWWEHPALWLGVGVVVGVGVTIGAIELGTKIVKSNQ